MRNLIALSLVLMVRVWWNQPHLDDGADKRTGIVISAVAVSTTNTYKDQCLMVVRQDDGQIVSVDCRWVYDSDFVYVQSTSK